MSGPVKKAKMTSGAGKNRNYYMQHKTPRKLFMQPGHVGFLATCNCQQKDCVRESYNILNSYADELYGAEKPVKKTENDEDEEDITDALENEISASKEQKKAFRFQAIDTGVANCIFIKTTVPDPLGLGLKIVRDFAKTKVQKTRYLLRLVPVEVVCKANLTDILAAAEPLFEKHFKNGEAKTFAINYNKRHNKNIDRSEMIDKLADLVSQKNCKHSVNLSNPDVSVIVEIIKGLCCLSVVEEYIQLKKYNLIEIVNGNKNAVADKKEDVDEVSGGEADNAPEEKENIVEATKEVDENVDDVPEEESVGEGEA